MSRIFLFILYFTTNIFAADNTLLNRQLDAINRQIQSDMINGGDLSTNSNTYRYNQNTIYIPPYKVREGFYIGANMFIGYFNSSSDLEEYSVNESTSIVYYRLGYIFKSNNRIELNLIDDAKLSYTTFVDKISGISLHAIMLFKMNESRSVHLKLQAGSGFYGYSSFSLEGISFEPAVGIVLNITEQIEVDFTYTYKYIYWQDIERLSHSAEVSSTAINGLSIGAKYKF